VTRVYQYLRTRVESEEEAKDLTQQVFLRALEALPRYRARGTPFGAWIFQIARHIATDSYRRRKRNVSWDLLPDVVPSSPEQNPETVLLRQEARLRLQHMLTGLHPYKRELLALRFAAGLSSGEIAQVVGKSPASVKKQLTRLLHTLKEAYDEA
jgi:RNA polymerase sigma-70 factor (ECF subfamily)